MIFAIEVVVAGAAVVVLLCPGVISTDFITASLVPVSIANEIHYFIIIA